MGGSTWVQNKIELFEGELVVFQRANSPNFYMRVYVAKESKHYQKSLRTKSQYEAIEKAKVEYKIIQSKVAKEEKVFTITFNEALEQYAELEKGRERRGLIKKEWYDKKNSYLKYSFINHFGGNTLVNNVSDKGMEEYIDIRLKRCKKKQTIQQEIVIIKHFYNSFLIKKGFVFKIPEFPAFKVRKQDKAKREDTFTIQEYTKLYTFLRGWVKPKNVSNTRVAKKEYGKKENVEKLLDDWERDMEIHRRNLIREMILIGANTGIRCPKEMLSLKWGDIRIKKETLSGLYGTDDEREELIAVIQINEEQKTGSRIVVGKAGSYFVRLKNYFRKELNYEPNDSDFVFMEFFGRRKFECLDKYALYRMWAELMRDCKLQRIKFTPYHLRHFFITQSILNGVDLMLIAKNCGNSINTIANHYEHIEMENQSHKLIKRRDIRKETGNEFDF
ncbi:MAG: site-specific integrase [Flavobacteriaceae bacterium]